MKKNITALLALVLGIVFSAFTIEHPVKATAGEKWFQLKPGGDQTLASDYSLYMDGSTTPTCTGSNVCAKLAVPDSQNGNIPNLPTAIDTKFRATN